MTSDADRSEAGHEAAAARSPAPKVEVEPRSGRAFDPKFVELLVCPLTRSALSYDAARQELVSQAARMAFPIRDGMPILVREEARHLDDADARRPTS